MVLKDYYNILQVQPNASLDEIKKAYRKLALQYHPDTATIDTHLPLFLDIKEAYEVLSDTKKRQAYHHKKFYKKYTDAVVTPLSILQQAKDLANLVAVLDPYRIDFDRLTYQIDEILNIKNIDILLAKPHQQVNSAIVTHILGCTLFLNYNLALPIHAILIRIADNNNTITSIINKQTLHQKRVYYWHKYKLLLAFLVAIILCVCFYALTN